MACEHRELEKPVLVIAARQGRPRGVRDARLRVQLIGGAQLRSVERLPVHGVRSFGHAGDLLLCQPDRVGDTRVVSPLVVGPAVPGRTQDDELSIASGQLAASQQLPGKRELAREQRRVAREGREDIGKDPIVPPYRLEHMAHRVRPVPGGQR